MLFCDEKSLCYGKDSTGSLKVKGMEDLRRSGKKRGLTAAVLKNTAYLTMLIDHIFAVVFLGYMGLHTVNGAWDPGLERIYRVGRAVGRVSFILFAYLIVEGFVHTRSRARYLLRLFLFALLSEIPFDLAFSGKPIDWSGQNIYWTLLLGVLVLTLWEYLGQYVIGICWPGRVLLVAAGCAAAFFGATDYRFMGVLLILVFYLTRPKGKGAESGGRQFLAVGCVMLFGTWGSNCIRYAGRYSAEYLFWFSMREMYGLSAFGLIFCYNGEKGRQFPKPVYYFFYPVHLLALYGIARAAGFT